ncbi:hypothetical protein DFH29DRAFT_637747 [Suillus ampliporus]|nr:hypothetical protein DFH29DRAFT_637747 [Suillus ampliporus]
MSTPPCGSTSRFSPSPSSSPSRSLTRAQPLSSTNVNQSFSTLPPEPILSARSSPGNSTINLSYTDANTRTRTESYPIPIRPHSPAHGRGHGSTSMRSAHTIANTPRDSILLSPAGTSTHTSPTPSVILTLHHHDDRKASSAPTSPTERVSPPASLVPEHSYPHRHLPDQRPNFRDTTPPNGAPRRWWSRSPSNERGGSVFPSRARRVLSERNTFPVVSAHVSDTSLLFPMSDDNAGTGSSVFFVARRSAPSFFVQRPPFFIP